MIIICALQVYNPWPPNLDALEGNLRREVAALDPAMIRRAILDMRVRANKCIDNNMGVILRSEALVFNLCQKLLKENLIECDSPNGIVKNEVNI